VEWQLDHAAPDGRWCFVHATHMTAAEMRRLAEAGVVAGLCPVTEANLEDGVFNGPGYLARGGRFGVGSDSNVLIGVAEELRQIEYGQRLQCRQRNVMTRAEGSSTGHSLYDAVAQGGSVALGAPAAVLAPGVPADLVSLDAAHPALLGRRGPGVLDGWIFAARTSPGDCVSVGGRKRVEGGRHWAREAILARYCLSLAELLAGER
jgi:formiminoglutamate deiminase